MIKEMYMSVIDICICYRTVQGHFTLPSPHIYPVFKQLLMCFISFESQVLDLFLNSLMLDLHKKLQEVCKGCPDSPNANILLHLLCPFLCVRICVDMEIHIYDFFPKTFENELQTWCLFILTYFSMEHKYLKPTLNPELQKTLFRLLIQYALHSDIL